MIISSRTVLALISLAPFINTSRLNVQISPAAITVGHVTKQLSTLHLADFEGNAAKGLEIWADNLSNGMETTVIRLDSEIAKVKMQPDSSSSAAALLHGFLEASGDSVDKTVDSIVKTALISCSFNLLRALATLYVWSSLEQFHWFQALGYKSDWYDPTIWQDNPVPMDWNNHLPAIFRADNPVFLNDIMSAKVPFMDRLLINNDTLLDLIAEHDSFKIYQFLNPAMRVKTLAESGSFKILRYLVESKGIDLHLEDYSLPNNLPEDFEFFWMQGYRYLPVPRVMKKACKLGRADIIKFLHQLDLDIIDPTADSMSLAATNGHLDVLEWALDHKWYVCSSNIGLNLLLNGHFKVFEHLQKRPMFTMSDAQHMVDNAAILNRLDIVKWLYDKFKTVPRSYTLCKSRIKVLEWIESVKPCVLNNEFAENVNLKNLKWLSENHPHLLTDHVKHKHYCQVANFEKIQWMILQGWKVKPNITRAATEGEIETMKFGYFDLQIKPIREHAVAAACNGHVEILKLINSIDSTCIDDNIFLKAIEHGHLMAAKYLEAILNVKGTIIHFELMRAFTSGNLELVEWAYQNYKLDPPRSSWLQCAITRGHLHIIDWAIKNQFILKTDEKYLKDAVQWSQYQIFRRLIDYGMDITEFEHYILLAFEIGCLKIVKYLATKYPESAKHLQYKRAQITNHHVWLWLCNQKN